MTFVQPNQTNEPLGPESIFAVKNTSDKPLNLTYDSRTWHWEPGQTQYVPFPVVALHFGDPRAIGSPAAFRDRHHMPNFIASREQEVARLRQMYGGSFKGAQDDFNGVDDDGNDYRLPHPHVEVYDTAGNRIPTVIDDPHGEQSVNAVPVTALSYDDQLAALQRQINALQAQRNQQPEQAIDVAPPDDTGDAGTHDPYVEPEPTARRGSPVDVDATQVGDLPSDD